jgi:glucose-1-phosphate cytidylyltransferase
LVEIGETSIIQHIIRYYGHYGHTEFILCLGFRADAIIEHFRRLGGEWIPTIATDQCAQSVRLVDDTFGTATITLVDTGVHTCIGQRLKKVERYLAGEDVFLANYADGLSDLPLPNVIATLMAEPSGVGAMVAVKPTQSFHYVNYDSDRAVTGIVSSTNIDARINGGYFVFRKSIFDYIGKGEDLVDAPFRRLIEHRKLLAYPYDGFWRACDTLKDVQELQTLIDGASAAPWEIWRTPVDLPLVASPAAAMARI